MVRSGQLEYLELFKPFLFCVQLVTDVPTQETLFNNANIIFVFPSQRDFAFKCYVTQISDEENKVVLENVLYTDNIDDASTVIDEVVQRHKLKFIDVDAANLKGETALHIVNYTNNSSV